MLLCETFCLLLVLLYIDQEIVLRVVNLIIISYYIGCIVFFLISAYDY